MDIDSVSQPFNFTSQEFTVEIVGVERGWE